MASRLDSDDRSILEFRPNIAFQEPDQEPGQIEGTDRLQVEDVQDARLKIKKVAQAVNTLAATMQARADQRAAGMVIQLDRNVDQDTVQAMIRRFPDADPTQITYKQYRECKNGIRSKGIDIGRQGLITIDDITKARNELSESGGRFAPGNFNTPAAANGGLRPELNANSHIIQPLDLERLQIDLICILVNYIWKNYVKMAMKGIPLVGAAIFALPDEICDPGFKGEIPGLLILGEQPDDLLTGKQGAEQFAETSEEAVQAAAGNTTSGSVK